MDDAQDAGAMPKFGRPSRVDYEGLAEFLRALSYPVRLELLAALQFPRSLAEIAVRPQRLKPGENPDRPASRQAIMAHLEQLVETGLIRVAAAEGEPPGARKYVVNPSKLYALTEELRRLCLQYAGRGPTGDATGSLAAARSLSMAPGPRLVLVHGVYEGRSYPLQRSSSSDGRWVIGRRRGVSVCLDYDPYVSLENSAIESRGKEWVLVDLPASKNGTSVNWSRMPKEGSMPLRAGDFVGVGRSLLCFMPH